jgi:IS30 family transposase
MGRRLREEEVMTIQALHERGCPNRANARTLGVKLGWISEQLGHANAYVTARHYAREVENAPTASR